MEFHRRLTKVSDEARTLAQTAPSSTAGIPLNWAAYVSRFDSIWQSLASLEEEALASGRLSSTVPVPKALALDARQQPQTPNLLRTRPDPEVEKRVRESTLDAFPDSEALSRESAIAYNAWCESELADWEDSDALAELRAGTARATERHVR